MTHPSHPLFLAYKPQGLDAALTGKAKWLLIQRNP